MTSAMIERAAYIAIYRVLTADLSAPELATRGARRSYAMDKGARIIAEVFEAQMEEAKKLKPKTKTNHHKGNKNVIELKFSNPGV